MWLTAEISLQDALCIADDDERIAGIVAKNAKMKPRFALRFAKIGDLQEFAKKHQIKDPTATSRWRMDGLPSYTGAVGAVAILESRGWTVEEVLYFSDTHCVFTAEQVGDVSPMHYDLASGIRQQIHLKALDVKARAYRVDKSKEKSIFGKLQS